MQEGLNHFFKTDPGTKWVKDNKIIISPAHPQGRVLTPNVIPLPNGGFRMYYYESIHNGSIQEGHIVSAFSPDGDGWTKEEGVRVAPNNLDVTIRVLCPEVITLSNGMYRMYYQAHSSPQRGVVLSALSSDGITWNTEHGIRIQQPNTVCGSPRCIPLRDGSWRLYFHTYPNNPKGKGIQKGWHIQSAHSIDGLNFTFDNDIRIPQESSLEDYAVYAVDVLSISTSFYRMYYSGWSTIPLEGRIFSATSKDGLYWRKDSQICLDIGGQFESMRVSEPSIIKLPNGKYKMFYEGNDGSNNWYILSATSL